VKNTERNTWFSLDLSVRQKLESSESTVNSIQNLSTFPLLVNDFINEPPGNKRVLGPVASCTMQRQCTCALRCVVFGRCCRRSICVSHRECGIPSSMHANTKNPGISKRRWEMHSVSDGWQLCLSRIKVFTSRRVVYGGAWVFVYWNFGSVVHKIDMLIAAL
jgi:hypothetical protein